MTCGRFYHRHGLERDAGRVRMVSADRARTLGVQYVESLVGEHGRFPAGKADVDSQWVREGRGFRTHERTATTSLRYRDYRRHNACSVVRRAERRAEANRV